jgi:AcrR family transcriptional regulator
MPTRPKRRPSKEGVRRRLAAPAPNSRRRDIVDHAVRLMEEKGFAAVSVQHMADALEFSKANFYHHVDSKEKLLHEIFVETLEHSLQHIEEIMARPDSVPDKLRTLVEFYVSLMTERRAVMLVWFKERAHLTPAHLEEVTGLERRIGAVLERFYGDGIAAGHFKPMDTDVMRSAIFGMCFQLTKLPRALDRAARAAVTRQLQELATTGLLAR